MPRLVLKDYYLVLGVSRDATETQLKTTFRRKIRETHPDYLGPDATEDEITGVEALAKELTEAWEYLSTPDKKVEVDRWLRIGGFPFVGRPEPIEVPDPEVFMFDGVPCWIIYHADQLRRRLMATVQVPLDHLAHMRELGLLPKEAQLESVQVVDSEGNIVGSGHSIHWVRYGMQRLRAEARRNEDRQTWAPKIEALKRDCAELARQGKPVDRLSRLVSRAEFAVGLHRKEWQHDKPRTQVVQAIREAEKEATRLREENPSEVLLAGLLDGSIRHPDVAVNNRIVAQLDILAIRTGGEVKSLSEKEVREHYRSKLEGVSSLEELQTTDLKLDDDKELIGEMIAEGLLKLAPDAIEIAGIKGPSSYPVEYWYEQVGGERLPVGIVTVPLVVYEKNCSDVGRKTTFPSLPYGIQLLVRVRVGNVASDAYPDGPLLKTEVKRCQRRKQRTSHRDILGNVVIAPHEEPPPWFVGRIRLW